ncbi:hypothetical protein LTR85_010679 [Meristemomyces frigidus]|nr:hypothetical protein LTR85_010679 [Meristemomyces frigidus]
MKLLESVLVLPASGSLAAAALTAPTPAPIATNRTTLSTVVRQADTTSAQSPLPQYLVTSEAEQYDAHSAESDAKVSSSSVLLGALTAASPVLLPRSYYKPDGHTIYTYPPLTRFWVPESMMQSLVTSNAGVNEAQNSQFYGTCAIHPCTNFKRGATPTPLLEPTAVPAPAAITAGPNLPPRSYYKHDWRTIWTTDPMVPMEEMATWTPDQIKSRGAFLDAEDESKANRFHGTCNFGPCTNFKREASAAAAANAAPEVTAAPTLLRRSYYKPDWRTIWTTESLVPMEEVATWSAYQIESDLAAEIQGNESKGHRFYGTCGFGPPCYNWKRAETVSTGMLMDSAATAYVAAEVTQTAARSSVA